MRTLPWIFLLSVVVGEAVARGSIGVYFDEGHSQNSRVVDGGIPFDVYVILHDIDSGVAAVEYRLSIPIDAAIIHTVFAGDYPLALVSNAGTAVGFGNCELAFVVTNHDYVIVATYTVVVSPDFSAGQLQLGPYVNPQDQAAAPRWADCGSGQSQQLYEVDQTGDAWLSAGVVAIHEGSWGRLKRLYAH